jgi:adenine nucleotide transporter 17
MPAAAAAAAASGLEEALSAAIGALTSAAVLYPLDLVKTRLQAQLHADNQQAKQHDISPEGAAHLQRRPPQAYGGIVDGFRRITSEDGIAGLYAGLRGYALKASIDNFTYFYWRRFLMNAAVRVLRREPLGAGAALVVSNASGVLHKAINLPLDVVSTRQQTACDGSGLLDNARAVIGSKGWGGLWDGLGPTLLLTTNPAITYSVFDAIKATLMRSGTRAKLGFLESFLAGVLSKATATIIIYPLIRAKVLQQRANTITRRRRGEPGVTAPTRTGLLTSIMDVFGLLAHVAQSEGIRGWYTGMPGQIIKASLSSALLLMTKEQIAGVVGGALRATRYA